MFSKPSTVVSAVVVAAGMACGVGCSRSSESRYSEEGCVRQTPYAAGTMGCRPCAEKQAARTEVSTTRTATLSEFPPNAKSGECYGKVYIPPKYEARTESVLLRDASQKVETTPARFEWVEERVCTKEACKTLVEVPAEYKTVDQTIEVKPGRTEWVLNTSGKCKSENGEAVKDVYCLVTTPPEMKTVTSQVLCKKACVREEAVPAEYSTVKRQKMVEPARTNVTTIPAEYQTVQRNVLITAGHFEWQRVVCDAEITPQASNKLKEALQARGYKTGPMNGKLESDDWNSIHAYQQQHGLGVGELTHETMKSLQVSSR